MHNFLEVQTKYPIAFDSPDHIYPHGTARDNFKNLRFNSKLFNLFRFPEKQLRIMDLGCSGGGFVKSCLDSGCFAVGIEGSDYSKKRSRAEWITLADKYLFTADISKEFKVLSEGKQQKFDVITAWEVMEHIPTDRLPTVCQNLHNHLDDNGLIIFCISPNEEVINGHTLHQTVKPKEWWIEEFAKYKLYHVEEFSSYFNNQYIRGPGQTAPGSFHLHLVKNIHSLPPIPKLKLGTKFLDYFYRSRAQKMLAKLVGLENHLS